MGCLVDPAAFGNFIYRQIRVFQKLLGVGEPQFDLVFMGRTAHIPGKLPDKVVFAHMKLPGQVIQKQRLLKMPVDIAFRLPEMCIRDSIEEAAKNWKAGEKFDWLTPALSCGMRREPGKEWQYCSFGFAILGAVIGKVSGMKAENYIDENILKPLGLQDTFFLPAKADKIKRINLLAEEEKEEIERSADSSSQIPTVWEQIPQTGGGLFSTPVSYTHLDVYKRQLIDSEAGDWYAMLFQDRGASGRIPFLMPARWEDDWPILGMEAQEEGKGAGRIIPAHFPVPFAPYPARPLVISDSFCHEENRLALPWQWNHNPIPSCWSFTARPGWLRLTTGHVAAGLTDARNTLTQRTLEPGCVCQVTLDSSGLKEGDYAGLCALQGRYGQLSLIHI